jgi:hypothetical protein
MFRRKMNALGYRIAAGCESVVRLQLMENRCLIAAIYESVQRVEYKGSSLEVVSKPHLKPNGCVASLR